MVSPGSGVACPALHHLPAQREIRFAANRWSLDVESLSDGCLIGDDCLRAVAR